MLTESAADTAVNTTASRRDATAPLRSDIAVLGFAALSGTGKTTLLCHLIPLLKDTGLRIGIVKHAHHKFEIDHPGKDSFRLRKAGAAQMLIASAHRRALIVENPEPEEPDLGTLLERLDASELDLVLVEGFKRERFAKIELHRPALGHPLQQPNDPNIIAIATDAPIAPRPSVPVLDLNDPPAVAAFVLEQIERWAAARAQATGRLAGNG